MLRPLTSALARPACKMASLVALATFAIAVFSGAIRVMPVLLAERVPAGVASVLARGVLGAAVETSLLVGAPIGFGVACAHLVARGEAAALFGLGASPLRMVRELVPAAFVFAALIAAGAFAWGREARAPGRALDDMVSVAERACERAREEGGGPGIAAVPGLDATWICFANAPPRIVGSASFGAFSAASFRFDDDLRAARFDDLRVLVTSADDARGELSAGRATITNLIPLAHGSNLSPLVRAALLSLSALVLALAAAGAVLVFRVGARAKSIAASAAGPMAVLLSFSSLEREPHGAAIYALVPVAGLAAIAAATFIATKLTRST